MSTWKTEAQEVAPALLPAGVHLVGSVPLPGAEQVFRTAAAGLGDRLRRLPDGETGRAGLRQVAGARIGLTQNAGGWHRGDNLTASVHVFEGR